eukprot:m.157612 g.157612  ORF g.157612 m.157612 type:complete len:156 (-) comp13350_c0_seq8:3036-3503(-)
MFTACPLCPCSFASFLIEMITSSEVLFPFHSSTSSNFFFWLLLDGPNVRVNAASAPMPLSLTSGWTRSPSIVSKSCLANTCLRKLWIEENPGRDLVQGENAPTNFQDRFQHTQHTTQHNNITQHNTTHHNITTHKTHTHTHKYPNLKLTCPNTSS